MVPVAPSTLEEVLLKLDTLPVMPKEAPDLKIMRKALEQLLNCDAFDPEHTIVVAGTNGKGSVCASLEALLIEAGESVGLYISPHLERITERIRINGNDISPALFCQAFDEVTSRTEELKLSHFETLTLMAVWLFFTEQKNSPVSFPKWKIFEVGLGGTWDATNAIPHQNSIITSLGYDHQELLGKTLEQIALNKFGIIGKNARVIHSPLPSELSRLKDRIEQETQSRWIESIPFSFDCQNDPVEGPAFHLVTAWGKTRLTLPGQRGAQNSATALTAFRELGFLPSNHLKGLEKVRWPGRMEKVHIKNLPCPVYFSGDHNPQGIASLVDLLRFYEWKRIFVLAGIGKEKDLDGILEPLVRLKDASLFLTQTPFRGRSIQEYSPKWLGHALKAHENPELLLQDIFGLARPGDLILVTGSLYLVGFLKRQLRDTNLL